MEYTVLENSPLFAGIPAVELRELLETTPHHIQCYDKGETIFHLMEPATRIGIILEGRVEAQKAFPNGSQVNVSVRNPGGFCTCFSVFIIQTRNLFAITDLYKANYSIGEF